MSDKNILDGGEEGNGVLSGEEYSADSMIDSSFRQDDVLRAAVSEKSADLKTSFRAGSIPLATDFANLIDVAECGRRAVGRSADQTDNNVGAGLVLAADEDAAHRGKLSIKAGNGITVDASGVGIDPERVLPRGVIVMFSGTAVPRGWALCDGKNETPDLRNRFVLAGELGELNKKSTSGVDANKSYTAESDSKSAAIHVKVDETKLLIEQIPAHSHDVTDSRSNGGKYGLKDLAIATGDFKSWYAITPDRNVGYAYLSTVSVGGGQGHTHTATATQDAHSYTTTITTPYYVLAFIMKT